MFGLQASSGNVRDDDPAVAEDRRATHLSPMDDKTKTIDEHLARVDADRTPPASVPDHPQLPPEHDGPKGPEPTRFGDWEQKGRCTDF